MRIRKALVATGIVLGSAAATTLAFAAWNADGNGAATVAAKTAQKLVVTNVSTPDALYPGGSSSLTVKVKNPNPYPVTVTSIANSGAAVTVVPLAGSTCDASNVSFTNQSVSTPIAANTEVSITVPGVKMVADAADGCQGASFTFPVVASGASSAS